MYIQRADGEFSVNVSGPYHCGADHSSPKVMQYRVILHYPDSGLDTKGFLLDNTAFREYFASLGTISISCELLARRVFSDLAEMARARRVAKIEAGISAVPGVWIEYIPDDAS